MFRISWNINSFPHFQSSWASLKGASACNHNNLPHCGGELPWGNYGPPYILTTSPHATYDPLNKYIEPATKP
jgi:hypothetical protein